jgi:hypothetical protein
VDHLLTPTNSKSCLASVVIAFTSCLQVVGERYNEAGMAATFHYGTHEK